MTLHREILRLALPSILANITVPLVGMVDLAVAGHLGGEDGSTTALLGGIAIGTMLFDLLYWIFAFLRAGTGGVTAQAYGRGDGRAAAEALARSMAFALGSGLAMILLQEFLLWAGLLLVECSPQVRTLAQGYFHIRIWAAPATLSLFALKGWMIGMQDSVRPMIVDLTINLVNIGASILLGFGYLGLPRLGFSGIAAGTVIAQWTGFTVAMVFICTKFKHTFRGRKLFSLLQGSWRGFFSLSGNLALRSVGMMAVYIGFTMISARYGDLMLSVGAIMMKLLMLFSFFSDGFAYAGEALTGRFIGEQSREGVTSTVRDTFIWGAGLSALFIFVYWVGGTPLLRLMTSDESVVTAGREFLPWLIVMPLTGLPAFIWDGIFIGATASEDLRNSTLLCAVGFFAAWFIGFYAFGGASITDRVAIHVLLAAYFIHLTVRSAYLTVRYRPGVLRKVAVT